MRDRPEPEDVERIGELLAAVAARRRMLILMCVREEDLPDP